MNEDRLNLGPATLRHLKINKLPNTIELKNYSEEDLKRYKIPSKSIVEIRDRLIKKLPNFKK